MAQAVVSSTVAKLGDLLIKEAFFLHGVHDQVEQLRVDLKRMQCFLKDADTKQEADAMIQNWVSEIRDIAYDAEDVIDTFILKMEEENRTPLTRGFMDAFRSCADIFNKGMDLHNIGKDIEALQKRLQDLSTKRDIYGIINLGEGGEGTSYASERFRHARRSSPYADEEDIVGLEDTVQVLVRQLEGDEQRRSVISIVGMGGLGKTSLAKKVYNHIDIKSRFALRAWVYVSQVYNTKDLLQRIIKSFMVPTKDDLEVMEKSTEEDLETWLYKLLEQHQYLVVIDDVWQSEAWGCLKRAFPDSNNGSRVLLTTRILDVALNADEKNIPHKLRFLNEVESWELFCKKAFPRNGDTSFFPARLEKLGRKMVGRCRGLPLGIIVLGGLLSKKSPSTYEWQRVLNHISQNLMLEQDRQIFQILNLSYNDLPFQLKSCFLYIGLFPEDFVIDTEKLFRLWVAEGFIPEGRKPMEEVAEDYLNELIDRNMIQVARRSWRRVEACRIHDLLRDISISKGKQESFLDNFEEVAYESSRLAKSNQRQRRLAIHSGIQRYVSLNHWHAPYLRSLVFFNTDRETLQVKQLRFIYTGLKLLRVLDLDNVRFDNHFGKRLPDEIGDMIHLRYLSLKETYLEELPSSIGNLQRLQTFDLRGDFGCQLPNVVWKMIQLRHLCGSWSWKTEHLRIDTLTNLQTLDCISVAAWLENDHANLTSLRDLKIDGVSNSTTDALSKSLSKLSCLQSLSIGSSYDLSPIALEFPHCHNLLNLSLQCNLASLTDLPEFLPNLTTLTLEWSELREDPMEICERLPNLLNLNIKRGAYSGNQMTCSAKGFPQLEDLTIGGLFALKEWAVEKGAMPRLRCLEIYDCQRLNVPEGLMFITTLQEMNITSMKRDFVEQLQERLPHVSSITLSSIY